MTDLIDKTPTATTVAPDASPTPPLSKLIPPTPGSSPGSFPGSPLDDALRYADLGWPVVPLYPPCPRKKGCSCLAKADCDSPGKHPRTAGGLKDATTDPEIIRRWWTFLPDSNLAVRTGIKPDGGGIVVLDIDPRHGGDDSLAELEREHGLLPETVEALTGGGGRHLLFAHPGSPAPGNETSGGTSGETSGVSNKVNLRPGLDVKADGGYIVVPPSVHPSDRAYRWKPGHAPGDLDLAAMPAWLLDLVVSDGTDAATASSSSAAEPVVATEPRDIAALRHRAERYADKTPPALPGGRNDAAYRLAGHLVAIEHDGKRLAEDQVLEVLRRWNARNPDSLDDGELEQCARNAMTNGTPRAAKPTREMQDGSQASLLAASVLEDPHTELFHTAEDEAYATIRVEHHGRTRSETMKVESKRFRRYVARRFYDQEGKAAKGQSLKDALGVISGHALYDGPEYEVAVRVTGHGGHVYLDLADDVGRVVEVTADGWRVILSTDLPPAVRFVRPRGMLSLPVPQRDGSVDELRPLLNVQGDDDWRLLVGFLVMGLIPDGPFPVLVLVGEQGSGKSTRARFIVWLVDPRKPALRRPPRNEQDLMIAAKNGRVIGYDNLSGLSHDLSDAICTLATGGGFGARKLYTDEDENLIDVKRPVMLNGIDDLANRSDLMDRAIILTLRPIPSSRRRAESKLDAEFERVRPRVLGALLDAVVAVLANRDATTLPELPRMADFARNIVAAERALGWPEGAFLAAYRANQNAAHVQAVEASPIGNALLQLMEDRDTWTGTPSELLGSLVGAAAAAGHYQARSWPRVESLGKQLRRLAPNLRALGIEVETGRRSGDDRQRFITLRRAPTPEVPPGNTSESSSTGSAGGGVSTS